MAKNDDDDERGGGLIDLDMGAFGSGAMNDPLRHAMGLRSAQDKCKMRMWDSFPPLFQNTIFHGEQDATIKELRRSGSLAERLARARELKAAGNAALKSASGTGEAAPPAAPPDDGARRGELEARVRELQEAVAAKERELKDLRHALKQAQADLQNVQLGESAAKPPPQPAGSGGDWASKGLEEAITSYERAAGILRYVECTRLDWRNDDGSYKGIEDVHLRVDASALEGEGQEVAEAREMVASCYLNIALASQKLGKFEQMRQACDEVLSKVNKESVKALYRRAQARVAPAGALDADRDEAIRDLVAAAQLSPQDKEVRGMLSKLRAEKKAKEASERSTFAGLFERGAVVEEVPRPEVVKEKEPANLDLRDPRVQRMLDVYPGPDSFQD
mmetsp:Transcript_99122/g.305544  ORF Transcript_99122/g.305544 Transcript_99122/m.305544 type:complete len:390 (+) Transcript_99122:86-1255(+)